MALNIEQQLAKYVKKVEPIIKKTMENEVFKVVQDEMIEDIKETVYDKYDPSQYIRKKENGGLVDRTNIVKEMKNTTLHVRNVRRDGGKNVAEIVRTGVGYTWDRSKIYKMQPYPRDFIKSTAEKLRDNGKHIEAFKDGMGKRGVEVR